MAGKEETVGSRMLADQFTSRDNSLNALRLVLALVVIVSHAPLLLGIGDPYRWADLEIGGWAVVGFFGISGWLIAGSRLNLDFGPFMWRRCLRILPAFWLVLAVTVLLFVPLAAWRTGDSPAFISTASYALNNSFLWIFQPEIEGTLLSSPTRMWNISLWTLSWEMLCYIGVGVLLSFRLARRNPLVITAVFVAVTLANLLARTIDLVAFSPALEAGLRLGSFFLAGAVLRMYAHRVAVSKRLAAGSVLVVAVLSLFGLVGSLGALPLAYLALYAGIKLPLSKIGSCNDISYGIYVYAFPVGQLIILFGGDSLNVWQFIALNVAVVVPFAWGSWVLVEKTALKLKWVVPARNHYAVAPKAPQATAEA